MVKIPRSRFMLHVSLVKGIQKLKSYCESDFFDGAQWGWKLGGSRMQPTVMDVEPVPGNLLKFIQCKCKLSMKNPCGSNISSCY